MNFTFSVPVIQYDEPGGIASRIDFCGMQKCDFVAYHNDKLWFIEVKHSDFFSEKSVTGKKKNRDGKENPDGRACIFFEKFMDSFSGIMMVKSEADELIPFQRWRPGMPVRVLIVINEEIPFDELEHIQNEISKLIAKKFNRLLDVKARITSQNGMFPDWMKVSGGQLDRSHNIHPKT